MKLFIATGIVWLWGYAAAWSDDIEPLHTRTSLGDLRAETVLSLQAYALSSELDYSMVAVSEMANIQIGQFAGFELLTWMENAFSVGTAGAIFPFVVTNTGNGDDQLSMQMLQMEWGDQNRWTIELFEDRNGDGIGSPSERMNGFTSPLVAGETDAFLVRIVPPNDRDTDGVRLTTPMTSLLDPTQQNQLNIQVGLTADAPRHSSATPFSIHTLPVAPALYHGRLYWIGLENSTGKSRLFFRRTPVTETDSTLANNGDNVTENRNPVVDFVPDSFSIVCGTGWFMRRSDGALTRVDLPAIAGDTALNSALSVVPLPAGVTVPTQAIPGMMRNRLFVIGSNNRLYTVNDLGQVTHSSDVITNETVSTPLLVTDRWIGIGTQAGSMILMDISTGRTLWSQRVADQPIRFRMANNTRRGRVMAVIGNNRIGCYLTSSGLHRWTYTAESTIISAPVYNPSLDAVHFLTADGRLHGVNTLSGETISGYPVVLNDLGNNLQSAHLELVTRVDRRAPYLYVVAQQQAEHLNTQTQGKLMMVSTVNPLTRFVGTQITEGADFLSTAILTGTRIGNLFLIVQRQAHGENGRILAYKIR